MMSTSSRKCQVVKVRRHYIYIYTNLCGIQKYYSSSVKSIQTLFTIEHLWTITLVSIGRFQ